MPTHNFSWLSPQVMYLLKYPLLNLVSHHYKRGFVPIVCLWTQINPYLSFLPPLRELSYYLIRSLLTFQACQFHSVTTSKYLVQCSILASLSLNTPRPSQNPVSIIFGPLNKFVWFTRWLNDPNCFHRSCFFQAWLRKFYSVWYSI